MQQKGLKSKRGFNPKLLYIENVFPSRKNSIICIADLEKKF